MGVYVQFEDSRLGIPCLYLLRDLPVLIFSLTMDVMEQLSLLFSGCANNTFWISNKSHNTHFKSRNYFMWAGLLFKRLLNIEMPSVYLVIRHVPTGAVQLSAPPPQQASCSLSLSIPLLRHVWEIYLTWICFKSEENLTKGEMWFRNPTQSCFKIKQMQILSPSLTLKMPRLAPISGLKLQLEKELGPQVQDTVLSSIFW